MQDPTALRENVRERLRVAQQTAAQNAHHEDATDGDSQAVERAQKEVAHLTQLELIVAQIEGARSQYNEHLAEQREWQARLDGLAGEFQKRTEPPSIRKLDQAQDELTTELQDEKALREAITAAKQAVEQASVEQESKQRELRRAKEQLAQNSDPTRQLALSTAVTDAERAAEVATQARELRKAELANLQLEETVQSLRVAYVKRNVELLEKSARFTPATLREILGEIDAKSISLTNRLREIQKDQAYLDAQSLKARERRDNAKAIGADDLDVAEAEFRAKDYAAQAAQLQYAIINESLERLDTQKSAWRHRFDLARTSAPAAESAKWIDESEAALDRLAFSQKTLATKIDRLRKQIATLEKKQQQPAEEGEPAGGNDSLLYWRGQAQRALEKQLELCEETLAEIQPVCNVHQKLLSELTSNALTETASRWLADAWDSLQSIWQYELASVNDRPITVAKIVQGIILLLIGLLASQFISRLFARRMLTRMGVNASATAALQSVAFYTLVLLFTLFALKVVEVPLTAFTVLGGALALGVGFGSQNIVNNFISGLILLAERPVKVGDLIQLQDIYGNVEHIGARSTRVRTGENLEIIVPNSTFLETNVVNWTLSDNHMRTKVIFGVMYGSPTGSVTQLSLKAAANHDRVFDKPAPFLIFADFGDNALVFELHFWVAVRTLIERRRIESEIRYNIDHLFREAGIVIAYPQRDVHFFADKPIRVEMAAPPQGDESTTSAA